MKIWTSIILFFLLTTANAQSTFPTDAWEFLDTENPCDRLTALKIFVRDSLNTTGLVVVKEGKIVMSFGDIEEVSYLASARKSILSMLYGKYVSSGEIALSKTLAELGIDDNIPLTKNEKKATIENLITARSGIYLKASNIGSDPNMPERGSQKPGDYFYYNNWDFNVAGTILENALDETIYETFERDLAIPLQLQDFDLNSQKKYGDTTLSQHLAYHFYLSTRDMARLGYLMLHNGRWKGKQLIPADWISRLTEKVSEAQHGSLINGYGYMWWLYNENEPSLEGAYTASGAYGQYITIIPKLDIVIAHKTKDSYDRFTSIWAYDELIKKVIHHYDAKNVDFSNEALNKFCGRYVEQRGEAEMEYSIYLDNNMLMLERLKIDPYKSMISMCNYGQGILSSLVAGQETPLKFSFRKDGEVEALIINGTKRIKTD